MLKFSRYHNVFQLTYNLNILDDYIHLFSESVICSLDKALNEL